MVKIITIFISEITHPYYVLYGFQPFLTKMCPFVYFNDSKMLQNVQKIAIFGIFWAYLSPLNIIWSYFYFSFRKHSSIWSFSDINQLPRWFWCVMVAIFLIFLCKYYLICIIMQMMPNYANFVDKIAILCIFW